MKKVDFSKMTRDFLMGTSINESRQTDIWAYLHGIAETLQSVNPRTMAGQRKVKLALEHMRSVRRHTRRLEERVKVLEEHVKVLEEGK